ncbi:aminofutalosine synthase MqnE [Bacillus horti]|uniref:Aminodeoxyfutalosine synthase n=1 Tax=Caldalkalibacillus horti TaxID=77523 RepID=A0ABT9VTT4_9BACI|nr:aminofutalosine synthase MqnE [Bacillus horti]MDQ0164396.1 aminodeoxyfutalosine synthase [Bacillus horti]
MNVTLTDTDPSLRQIVEKVYDGERLTLEDGVKLYHSPDILTIGQLANHVNMKKNEDRVYFIENMTIYHTNVCEAHCRFCNFRKDPGEEGSYTYTGDELVEQVRQKISPTTRELHMVGGHNHTQPFEYYVDIVRKLKQAFPHVTMKMYTPAEIEFFSRIAGISTLDVLKTLIDAGLETMPGGGAEILSERYRLKMSPDKVSSQQWLDIHKEAHQLGLKTHATMLYGSIETIEERVEHMLQLRQLQDETNGYMVFIPLAVQPISANAGIKRRTSAFDDIKTIAISRLMLDNFNHIKAYFINIGTQLTQLALSFGASDVHGTLIEERISHAAGALTPAGLTRDELVWLVKGANKKPLERDTFYNVIKEY